jgi:hypothetical protein
VGAITQQMTPASRQRRDKFLALLEQYCRVGELLPGSIIFGDQDELEEVVELLDELHGLSVEIYQVLAEEMFHSGPPVEGRPSP